MLVLIVVNSTLRGSLPMKHLVYSKALAILCAYLIPGVAAGQGDFSLDDIDLGNFGVQEEQDPVTVEAQFVAATPDRPAVLMITAAIDPGWHVYSLTQPKGGPRATKIKLTQSPDYKAIGNWASYPEPHRRVDKVIWKGLTLEEHDDQVTWYAPVEIAEGVDVSNLKIAGSVSLQACKESCIPLEFDFVANQGPGVPIGEVKVTQNPAVATQPPPASKPPSQEVPTPPSSAGIYRAKDSTVTWYGWLEQTEVTPGARTQLMLRAEMPANWHINAYAKNDAKSGNKPTLIAVKPADGLTFYQPQRRTELTEKPSPVEGFGLQRYHEQQAVWVVPIDVLTEMNPGEYAISGLIGYQACEANEQGLGSCELQKGIQFSAMLKIASQGSPEPGTVSFKPAKYADAAVLASKIAPELVVASGETGRLQIIEFGESVVGDLGLIGMLGAALLGGLILNLMPCVLPVIGLKIMAFAKQGGESRSRVFLLNLTYVAGLLSVFLLLATLASLTQWGLSNNDYEWGELNTQTWFKVSMTALVFVMALSFLGVWEIPLPGFAGSSTAASMASREGFGGAFFKGILTTILATPCSGPFLGPVFGYTIGQGVGTTYLIFLCVGLGMALPYLLIGAVPSLVQWIPKPGMWMETFKQFMAFVLLGTVVYLLSTINQDEFIPTMSLLVALWFACWLGGRTPITVAIWRKATTWTIGMATAMIIGYVGFFYERETELPWKDFSAQQLTDSLATGETVLVDFTANWCPTCKWNLRTAIDVPAVNQVVRANQVQAIKADWTDEDEDIEQTLEMLRSRSIPLLAIYPAGRPNEVIVLRDTVTETQVLQALALAGALDSNPQHDYAKRQAPQTGPERVADAR